MKKALEILVSLTGIVLLIAGVYLMVDKGFPKPFWGAVGFGMVTLFFGWNAKYIWSLIKPK